jgi:hypothetical protein
MMQNCTVFKIEHTIGMILGPTVFQATVHAPLLARYARMCRRYNKEKILRIFSGDYIGFHLCEKNNKKLKAQKIRLNKYQNFSICKLLFL